MHKHGHVYRAKIVSTDGRTEHSDWFNTEKELRDAMQATTRILGKRYYCEAKTVPCLQEGCDVDQTPRVISSL
jgi:hypothetical protein